jgi:hypothetical protein
VSAFGPVTCGMQRLADKRLAAALAVLVCTGAVAGAASARTASANASTAPPAYASTAPPAHASTAPPAYAPLDHPGPPLSVPLAKLTAALQCEPSVRDARVEPVLLNPATGVTAEQNYSWNWEPALSRLGIPWCAYTAPNSTLNDIQTSGEYLVYAIRTMYALAHRRIAIMGHSQGGMSMRWALRFWPDTRTMLADVVGFSGSNHGTTVLGPGTCETLGCPPADWQQLYQSPFIRALNSYAETFAGISYTEIYTHTDEVVQPNSGYDASAALHTGAGQITNVATQQLCPGDVDEHLAIGTIDPVAYALAIDAITHPGPANVARVAREPGLCSKLYMPGVNPLEVNTYLQILAGAPGLLSVAAGPLATATTGAPVIKSPPPLDCYVSASCAGAQAPTLHVSIRRGRHSWRVLVSTREGQTMEPVPGATVTLAGRRARAGRRGRAFLDVRLSGRRGRQRVRATLRGCNPATATVA